LGCVEKELEQGGSSGERARVRGVVGVVGVVGAVVVLYLFEALVERGGMWWKWQWLG